MEKLSSRCLLVLALAAGAPARAQRFAGELDVLADQALGFAGQQLLRTSVGLAPTLYPKTTSGYSVWTLTTAGDWAAGFYPGALWLVHEATGEATYRGLAETWTAGLAGQQLNTSTHDVGFIVGTSFGNGYRLTGDPAYAAVLVRAAGSLATRYDPDVGCTRSWSWGPWTFPVIIDNLMNLELLFWAARHAGSVELSRIAVRHALVTREHHLRPDGSTYHLVDFDPESGAVLAKGTWSGASSESTWSRGQAWAIHGFTMAFRESGEPLLLEAAERAAGWFLAHVPPDGVPYWDFEAPGIPETERDTSAAAIAAAGLLELSTLAAGPAAADYRATAETILRSLATPAPAGGYLARGVEGHPTSPGLLLHGCGGHPASFSGAGVPDESLIWGDYYLIQALLRWRDLAARRVHWGAAPPRTR